MSALQRGLLTHLRQNSPGMSETEKRVVNWVLEDPGLVLNMSIREVAQAAGVSDATVVRTAQRLGFDGFPQLKLALAFDLSSTPGRSEISAGEVKTGDSLDVIAGKVFESHIRSLTRSLELLDPVQLERTLNAVLSARRLEVYSNGTQAHLVERCVSRFIATGICCIGRTDAVQQALSASIMEPEDVLLIFSHSGRMKSLLKAAELAKDRGATVIVVTNFAQSPLGKLADIPIISHGEEILFYSESMGSEATQIALVDCLLVAIASRHPERVLGNLVTSRRVVESLRR